MAARNRSSPGRSSSPARSGGEAEAVWDLVALVEAVDDVAEALRLGCTGLHRLVPCRMIAFARPGTEDGAPGWSVTVYRGDGRWEEPEAVRELAPILERAWSRGRVQRGEAGPAAAQVHAIAAAPLLTRHRRYGVVVAGRAPGSGFSSREIGHLTRLAQHLAVRLERAGGRRSRD